MTLTNVYSAVIEPVEPVLFGDNRSARAGMDHFQLDQDPSPLALHGALGMFIWRISGNGAFPAALGEKVDDILESGEASVAELLGVAFRDSGGGLWFPKPLHLRCRKELPGDRTPRFSSHDLLRPSSGADGAKTSCPLERVLDAPVLEREADDPLLVSEHYLREILSGDVREERIDQHVRPTAEAYRSESRPGIVIQNATGRVKEGMFFSRPYRKFAPASLVEPSDSLGWGFAGWYATPQPLTHLDADHLGYLGGDRRRVRIRLRQVPSEGQVLASVRDRVFQRLNGSSGFLLYSLTPRIVAGGADWPSIEGARPIAAATGRTRFVSGWNAALHQPRPLLSIEPAGSVYFFAWPDDADEREKRRIVTDHWMEAVGRGGPAGFGRVLVGVWK